MTDVTSLAPAFASPIAGDTSGAVHSLAAGRLNSTRKRVARALLESNQDQIAESLLAFSRGETSAWRPETGLALMAYRGQQNQLAALQTAAAYAGMGSVGQLIAFVEKPQWLYLDGWLTAISGHCTLSAERNSLTIHSALGTASYQVSDDRRWIPTQQALGPWSAVASGGLAPRYVSVTGLRNSVEGFPWISIPPQAPEASSALSESALARVDIIRRGWDSIVNQAPIYAPWIASTAAGCLLIDPSGTHVAQSGSSFDHPGLIAIEVPDCPLFCGEILVHECSHQQMLVYSMIAPLVKPGTQEMSYSPIKRANRPIDRVLTGAHAVGNMIIYYEILRHTIKLDPQSEDRLFRHKQWFAMDYRPALSKSESLTDAGRVLWDSLCQAVDSVTEQ